MEIRNIIQNTGVQCYIVNMTPDWAEEILENQSTLNRSTKDCYTRNYSDTLKKGQWVLNGESIVFDENDKLIDGYHRLSAVISTGCAMPTILVAGVEHSAMKTFDQGKQRTKADILHFEGYEKPHNIVKMLNFWIPLILKKQTFNISNSKVAVLPEEYIDFVKCNLNAIQDSINTTSEIQKNGKVISPAMMSGIYAYLTYSRHHHRNQVYEYLNGITTGVSEYKTIQYIQSRLVRINTKKERATTEEIVYLISVAWYRWIRFDKVTKTIAIPKNFKIKFD